MFAPDPDMERWLVVAGSAPFALLGIIHLVYTLADQRRPRRIAPRDRELVERMRASPLGLTDGTDMWRAWIGFNLSHGVGVCMFAAVTAYFAVFDFEVYRSSPALTWGAPALAAIYVVLSWRYWFRVPLAGSALGAACLISAAAAMTFSG
jgi:hypothetical protein